MNGLVATAPAAILGQLPYSTADQFETAQARLAAMLDDARGPRATAARGLEALARRNRKLGRLSDETLDLLKKGARWELPVMKVPDDEPIARESFAALMAAGVWTRRSSRRRSVKTPRGSAGSARSRSSARAQRSPMRSARASFARRSRIVITRCATTRLRAWIRRETTANGCGPIAEALGDQSLHLVLAAIDALGDRCLAGDEAEALTGRLLAELRTPPDVGSWHREAHALVAVAKRTPDRAAMAMGAFRTHNVWQVRMYAARAAEPLKDVFTLQKLAYDDNDNVREAALMPLQRLAGADSEPAFIAALGRQRLSAGSHRGARLEGPRLGQVRARGAWSGRSSASPRRRKRRRATRASRCSSDCARPAVRRRRCSRSCWPISIRASPRKPRRRCAAWGSRRPAAPRPLPREVRPAEKPSSAPLLARFELDTGRFFEIHFDRAVAPLAYRRISQLIRDKYYDGLTFHRVVPNFVIQGGSPGANEYAGAARFMRDELSERPHARGTVGLSTRGHHTGDAQIFVNLADNRMLDLEYTVIGAVDRPSRCRSSTRSRRAPGSRASSCCRIETPAGSG